MLWADFGADFYAGQSWSDVPDGRRIMLGWMNNWTYAQDIPTGVTQGQAWRGQMTLPRELGLIQTTEGIRLTQKPVAEIELLRGEPVVFKETLITSDQDVETGVELVQGEIIVEFLIEDVNQADQVGVRLRAGDGEETLVGYAPKARKLFVTRGESGQTDFSDRFTPGASAPYQPTGDTVRLHILVDRESVELFSEGGRVVLTSQIFSAEDSNQLSLFVKGGGGLLSSLKVYTYSDS